MDDAKFWKGIVIGILLVIVVVFLLGVNGRLKQLEKDQTVIVESVNKIITFLGPQIKAAQQKAQAGAQKPLAPVNATTVEPGVKWPKK